MKHLFIFWMKSIKFSFGRRKTRKRHSGPRGELIWRDEGKIKCIYWGYLTDITENGRPPSPGYKTS